MRNSSIQPVKILAVPATVMIANGGGRDVQGPPEILRDMASVIKK